MDEKEMQIPQAKPVFGMQKQKVSPEAAESEFERFVACMRVMAFRFRKTDDEKVELETHRERLVIAIEDGRVSIDNDGRAVVHPLDSDRKEPLVFNRRNGASLMVSDNRKDGRNVAKMYTMMGQMCGCSEVVFAGLVGEDIKVCEAIFALLMA